MSLIGCTNTCIRNGAVNNRDANGDLADSHGGGSVHFALSELRLPSLAPVRILDMAGNEVCTCHGVGNGARGIAVAHAEYRQTRHLEIVGKRVNRLLGKRIDHGIARNSDRHAVGGFVRHTVRSNFLHLCLVDKLQTLGCKPTFAHHPRPSRSTHEEVIDRAWVKHDHSTTALKQITSDIASLKLAAHNDNPLAKRQLLASRNRTVHVVERHNIDRSVGFHGQHRYDRSRSDNHSIRVKRNNVIRHGLDTAANIHSHLVELADEILLVRLNLFMRALDGLNRIEHAAKLWVFLEQRYLVTALRSNARGLHSCGTAAHHNDSPGFRSGDRVITLRHIISKSPGKRGVDTTIHRSAKVIGSHKARHAVRAGSACFALASGKLVGHLWIGHQRACCENKINLAVANGIVDEVGRHASVHGANTANGNAHAALNLCCHANESAIPVMAAIDIATEVFTIVDNIAVAGLTMLINMERVRHETAAVVSVCLRAHMQGTCTRRLEQLGHLAGFLDRGKALVSPQFINGTLNARIKHLDNEVFAHSFADT